MPNPLKMLDIPLATWALAAGGAANWYVDAPLNLGVADATSALFVATSSSSSGSIVGQFAAVPAPSFPVAFAWISLLSVRSPGSLQNIVDGSVTVTRADGTPIGLSTATTPVPTDGSVTFPGNNTTNLYRYRFTDPLDIAGLCGGARIDLEMGGTVQQLLVGAVFLTLQESNVLGTPPLRQLQRSDGPNG